jgi:hypothetical protein
MRQRAGVHPERSELPVRLGPVIRWHKKVVSTMRPQSRLDRAHRFSLVKGMRIPAEGDVGERLR